VRCREYDRNTLPSKGHGDPTHPPRSFWRRFCLFAAVMSLVTVVADLTPFGYRDDPPGKRLAFIAAWALAMAWIERRFPRDRATTAPPSPSTNA
jgi:hypothetical protein